MNVRYPNGGRVGTSHGYLKLSKAPHTPGAIVLNAVHPGSGWNVGICLTLQQQRDLRDRLDASLAGSDLAETVVNP